MPPVQTNQVEQLKETLQRLNRLNDQEWIHSLCPRKQEEASYHDYSHSPEENASRETGRSNKKFYTTVRRSNEYLSDWIRAHAPGKVFLDYACGIGEQALAAAAAGAALAVGLDISPVSVQVARQSARERGLTDNAFFLQGDCEKTGFPDNSIDVALCAGVLHHMDLSYALPELRRILKPGGVILGVEALNHNPLIKLYRRLTPELRTAWEKEHILGVKDLDFASYFFDVRDVRYWHLFSVLTTPLRKTALFPAALAVANGLDSIALRIPLLNRMAWMFTFELVKRGDGSLRGATSVGPGER